MSAITYPNEYIYPNEYFERWAEIYIANRLRERGILLETFLEAPDKILAAVTWGPHPAIPRASPSMGDRGGEFLPLLPRQLEVAMRLRRQEGFGALCEAVEAEIQRRIDRECVIGHGANGALIEALHHRCHVAHRLHNTLFLPRAQEARWPKEETP